MAVSRSWLLSVYVLLTLTSFFDALGLGSGFILTASTLGAGVLVLFGLSRSFGALVVGRLLDVRSARWCMIVTTVFTVAHSLLVSLSCLTAAALGPSLLTHMMLVAQVTALQESSSSSRAYVLAHGRCAGELGFDIATLLDRWLAPALGNLQGKAVCSACGHLLLLPLALRIVRGESQDTATSPCSSKWSESPLPAPVSGFGDACKGDLRPIDCLKLVLSQPVMIQLVLVQLLAQTAQNVTAITMPASVLTDLKAFVPYGDIIAQGCRFSELFGLAVFIGVGISKLTPQAFICICLAWRACMSFLVAFSIGAWSPDRRFVSMPIWVVLAVVDRMWDKALEVVVTWLLVSGVPREHRGLMVGVSYFLGLFPLLPAANFLAWGVLYPRGGAMTVYCTSSATNLLLLVLVRQRVLPHYRQKDD